jgi:hypothetical protein
MLYRQLLRPGRLFPIIVAASWIGLTFALTAYGQVSPDEHQKHHPQPQGRQEKPAEGEMNGMMSMMGIPPSKELYPSLMQLPQLSPEKRIEVQRQAHERMQAGADLLTQGLEELV